MHIDNIDRAILHGRGISPSHVLPFLDKIDSIIAGLNPLIGDPGSFDNRVVFNNGLTVANTTLASTPGSMSWDPIDSVLNIQNEYPGSVLQVGQELLVPVCNTTGVTLDDGVVVQIGGYSVASDCFSVSLAQADSLDTAQVLGFVTTTMEDGERGLVTVFGRVNGVDTRGETSGSPLYLSESVAGGWTTTKPAVAIQLGAIGAVGEDGNVLVNIQERQPSVYGSFYQDVSHVFSVAGTPEAIPMTGEFGKRGITHSTTVNPEEILFPSSGVYVITGNFQVGRSSGGASPELFQAWLEKYPVDGSAWEAVPFTLIGNSALNAGDEFRLSANVGAPISAGDKLRVRGVVSDTSVFLEAKAAGGGVPAQASVMFSLYRLGDL